MYCAGPVVGRFDVIRWITFTIDNTTVKQHEMGWTSTSGGKKNRAHLEVDYI